MSCVIRVAAMGATALALMLYFAPSWASVLIRPTARAWRHRSWPAEVAEKAAGRRGDDDTTKTVLAEVRPRRADHVVAAVQVHLQHGVPVPELHLVERAVAQDARVAHHAVDLAELVERVLMMFSAPSDSATLS